MAEFTKEDLFQFPVVESLSWDNPDDVPILEHIATHKGMEYAEMATMPKEEYLLAVCELMALNADLPEDDDSL